MLTNFLNKSTLTTKLTVINFAYSITHGNPYPKQPAIHHFKDNLNLNKSVFSIPEICMYK